jgi:hypothetical protein
MRWDKILVVAAVLALAALYALQWRYGSGHYLVNVLLPTFLSSRLFLWLSRKRAPGVPRLLGVHLAALALCCLLEGLGNEYGVPSPFQKAFGDYLIPQIAWFVFDLAILAIRRKSAPQP